MRSRIRMLSFLQLNSLFAYINNYYQLWVSLSVADVKCFIMNPDATYQ
jgi:hypothetical protein